MATEPNIEDTFINEYKPKFVGAEEDQPLSVDVTDFMSGYKLDTERDTTFEKETTGIEKTKTFFDQADKALKKVGTVVGGSAVSGVEVGLTLATAAVTTIVGADLAYGLMGAQGVKNVLGMKMTEDDIRKYKPVEVIAAVQELMYKPETFNAQKAIEWIGLPGEMYHENVATGLGDVQYYVSDYIDGKISDSKNSELAIGLKSTSGALVTALADYAAPQMFLTRMLRPALGKIRSGKGKSIREDAVSQYIYNRFDSIKDVKKRYDDLVDLGEKIPGYKAGIVELSRDPGIAGIKREIGLETPSRRTENVRHAKENRRAIKSFMESKFGYFIENDRVMANELELILHKTKGNVNAAVDYLFNKLEDNISKQEALSLKLSSGDTPVLGGKLRKTMAAEYQLSKSLGNILYERVGNPRVVADSFARTFSDAASVPAYAGIVKAKSKSVPSLYYEITGELQHEIDKVSVVRPDGTKAQVAPLELDFTQLKEWDQALNRKIRMLERQQDAGSELTWARTTSTAVTEAMNSLGGIGGRTQKLYTEAKNYWNKEVHTKYQTGVVGMLLEKDINGKHGVYNIIDESVIDQIFNPGTKTQGGKRAIDGFLSIYGDSPVAMMQLKEGVYRKLKDAADPKNTGILDQAKVEAFISKNNEILNSLPEWKKDFTEIKRINHGLAVVEKRLIKSRQLLENSQLANILNENPYKLMEKAIKNPSVMRNLMVRISGDDMAQAALPRALQHYIIGKAAKLDSEGIWNLNPSTVRDIINDPQNKRSVSMVLKGDHVKNLNTLIDAYESQIPIKKLKEMKLKWEQEGFQKKFEEEFGGSLKSMMGDIRLAAVRHVPWQYIGGGWVLKKLSVFKDAAVKESIASAFFDKDMAQILSDIVRIEEKAVAKEVLTPKQAKANMAQMKVMEKRLREVMVKNGTFGFDQGIANAQAIANIGRIEDLMADKEAPKPELVVQ